MIDVAHDRHDRRARRQAIRRFLGLVLGLLGPVLGRELDAESELVGHGHDGILVEPHVHGGHQPEPHAGGDDFLWPHLHEVGQLTVMNSVGWMTFASSSATSPLSSSRRR